MKGGLAAMGNYVCTCCRKRPREPGGNTRASIRAGVVCPEKCVYVCVLCMIVTGGVYFGSVHRLAANK